MAIHFYCPLGHLLSVPDDRAGKKGRCPYCHQKLYVPIARPRPARERNADDNPKKRPSSQPNDVVKVKYTTLAEPPGAVKQQNFEDALTSELGLKASGVIEGLQPNASASGVNHPFSASSSSAAPAPTDAPPPLPPSATSNAPTSAPSSSPPALPPSASAAPAGANDPSASQSIMFEPIEDLDDPEPGSQAAPAMQRSVDAELPPASDDANDRVAPQVTASAPAPTSGAAAPGKPTAQDPKLLERDELFEQLELPTRPYHERRAEKLNPQPPSYHAATAPPGVSSYAAASSAAALQPQAAGPAARVVQATLVQPDPAVIPGRFIQPVSSPAVAAMLQPPADLAFGTIWLTVALAMLGLIELMPTVRYGLGATSPMWARIVASTSVMQIFCAGWIITLTDWSSLKVGAFQAAFNSAVYAVGIGLLFGTAKGSPLPLDLETVRKTAGAWCAAQVFLNGALAFALLRMSNRWRSGRQA